MLLKKIKLYLSIKGAIHAIELIFACKRKPEIVLFGLLKMIHCSMAALDRCDTTLLLSYYSLVTFVSVCMFVL